ncbi:efflux RND transporter periplasmic adaptor subunit [Thiobacillus sedimenti]|uniref:HlyD family efflux transporter periplasmic adaptor subunit n=1 Tax=Thiobacillus sedimenti TaxID=3110231 RepID=A0ABZ1CJV4_9PROT|nr:HlyD family efflux transporter periplasmic adaptor subunit [Thiobacillus sp. SCUT-2]WRS39365.1 HlyD family efflux transporter periplasmic adaptor subunit [Thiobacillus sp. SCUT-2]
MKNKRIPILIVAAVAVAAGVGWFRHNGAAPEHALTLHGNVDIRQAELAFNASGRITRILVQEGDRVKAGQLLAVLDTERLALALKQAEAQTAAQREVVARYRAGSRPEEIRQARAQRDAAQVGLADAEATLRRQTDLVARHFISQQQADTARFARDRARDQLQAAEASLHLAELGPRKEDVAAAQATLAANEAAVGVLRRDLQEGELRAPSAGVIENRILEPGDMASPQKPVFTLALTDPVWVRTWLAEPQLGRVPVGARAWVQTDSHPGKRYRAWVGYVSPSAEFTPKSVETSEIRSSLVYQARVFVCEGQGELRLGMPATVTVPLDQAAPAQGADPCADAR